MVDFDLPAVDVDLEQGVRPAPQVGRQQLRRLAVVPPGALAFPIRGRRDDE
jgi:hypothetical protein